MPIEYVYYTDEIRFCRDGNYERYDYYKRDWIYCDNKGGVIKIEGKPFNKKALYDFCYDIRKQIIKKSDRIADGAFLRLNKFYD